MFKALMPKRREFFDLLAAHSDRVVAAANAALRLIQALGTHGSDIDTLVKEVAHNEKSADQIKIDLIALLHKSFTTPINRDQIHTLTIDLDRVLHALRHVANAIDMYNIGDSTSEMRELASLAADACLRLNRAVIALGDNDRSKETMDLCKTIDQIESKADKVMRNAITKLFKEGGDVWAAVKLKDFYMLQDSIIDHCDEAAKTIEQILIENS
jgi:predicted phosphate transport protein (TIGR00153 family)